MSRMDSSASGESTSLATIKMTDSQSGHCVRRRLEARVLLSSLRCRGGGADKLINYVEVGARHEL